LLGEEALFLIARVSLDLELVVPRGEVTACLGIVGATCFRGAAGVVSRVVNGRVQ
jgi:hypothetical protein